MSPILNLLSALFSSAVVGNSLYLIKKTGGSRFQWIMLTMNTIAALVHIIIFAIRSAKP